MIEAVVEDDGPGFQRGALEHVFDPFFTTRQQEGGTGLGLSIVHGIITGHGGTIEILGAERKGASIRIKLPVIAHDGIHPGLVT